jgi:hypothetical protein
MGSPEPIAVLLGARGDGRHPIVRDPWGVAIARGGRPAERLSYFGGIWHHAHWHSLCVCVQSIQQLVFEGGMGLFVQVRPGCGAMTVEQAIGPPCEDVVGSAWLFWTEQLLVHFG